MDRVPADVKVLTLKAWREPKMNLETRVQCTTESLWRAEGHAVECALRGHEGLFQRYAVG